MEMSFPLEKSISDLLDQLDELDDEDANEKFDD